MAKRFEWDAYPGSYIELPDEWCGKHSRIRREAVEQFEKQGLPEGELRSFGVALLLLDDFSLPGLAGPERNWDFEELPLGLIQGVNAVVWGSYHSVMLVPKAYSEPSQNGQTEATETAKAAGGSETT